MNLTGVLGHAGYWGVILLAMTLAIGITPFIDATSIVIVILGTAVVIIASYPGELLANIGKLMKIAFSPSLVDHVGTVHRIASISKDVKQEGILILEQIAKEEEDDFFSSILKALSESWEEDDIAKLFYEEKKQIEDRHNQHIEMIDNIGGIAGSMGMIGTLIGLVAMLLNMSDPAAIGPAMAVALLTTLYGALIGTGIASPIATTLGAKSKEESFKMLVQIEGGLLIAKNENPRIIEKKLLAMIPLSKRRSFFT